MQTELLANVTVQRCTATATTLPRSTPALLVRLLDVFHHFEYPVTFMRSVYDAMAPDRRVFLVEFHRDPERVKSMPSSWALQHLRADLATFQAEVERAGFRLVASPELPELSENYIMVFEKQTKV